ncbi:MAG: three-Cys-motif partner protein TcmP [Microcoleaceae cyanobacterium MO_207.B10]|nr:three-Cys-motif partner protein TcmP [Microcoleaceae cyanobacterium MO_207.B10]
MSNSQPKWGADGSDIPTIDPHTKAKHQIIEEYIENLIITLHQKTRRGEENFTFIDGFCGGGIYDDQEDSRKWEGSPIRIIKAVRSAYKKCKRKYPLNVKYIFIDNKKNHINCLKNYSMLEAGLEELVNEQQHEIFGDFGSLIEQCEFICSDFENAVSHCIDIVKNRKGHSFFLIDPFGWSDVSMSSIRSINNLKGTEILYTYMIERLKRFVIGKHSDLTLSFNTILEASGYYESENLKLLDRVSGQRYLRNESLRLFRDKGNTKHIHTFSLIPRGYIDVLYYLMHFSQNITALQVMKETLWKYNNLHHLFEFKVYGFGLKTIDYYEQQQKLDFCIESSLENHESCIDILDKDLGKNIINGYEATFEQICNDYMEKHPATKNHFEYLINRLLQDKEIEILRANKILRERDGKNIRKQDIIRYTGNKQLYLF